MGIAEEALFAVTRVQCTFADDQDRETVALGTGVWLLTAEKRSVFITSRRNVDPRGWTAFGSHHRTKRVAIQLRERGAAEHYGPAVRYFVPKGLARALWVHDRADVAMLAVEDWTGDRGPYAAPLGAQEADLAGAATFATELEAADPAMFASFASNFPDDEWSLPIAHTACIASRPSAPYRHESISTEDVLLVSSGSFAGSSGSPVWVARRNREKRVLPRRLIGMMSGPFDEERVPGSTGLSYLTRSTSILELLAMARSASFARGTPFEGLHPMAKI
jgi:hypothetical protein